MRVAPEIVLTREERAELTRLAQSKGTNARLAQRARIVLLATKGMQNKDIAAELNVGRVQVSRWRERYQQFRLTGIERDLPRGTPSAPVDVARLVRMTTQSKPDAATHWSTRTMAVALGVSPASVSRHWRAHGLKPHEIPGFASLRAAEVAETLEDIVGLHMLPGAQTLVLCCDETSRSQAPDDKPPAEKGRAVAPTRDNWRHGGTTLFGALKMLDQQLAAERPEEPSYAEWLRFLRRVERENPNDKTLHVLTDAHVANKHPALQKWFASHERFILHLSPVSTPWLDNVDRFLGDANGKRLRQIGCASLPNLIASIKKHVAQPSANPGSFFWTKNTREARRNAIRAANGPISSQKNDPSLASQARLDPNEDGPRQRESGAGQSLRDNVITLKRDRILHEAAKLFFERGYLQTSVDAIAERLGATKPFVYYHFKSKVDILVEICEKSIRDVLAAADTAMSARGSPSVRFEQFLREFTTISLQQNQLVAIYFREEISLPKDAAERINQMRKSIDQRMSSLLSEGINTGDFQIEDPRIGALVIAGMSSYAFAWYREHGRLDLQEVTDRIVRMALKLVSASPYHRPAYRIHSMIGA